MMLWSAFTALPCISNSIVMQKAWHWRTVVDWLASEGRIPPDSPLIDNAHILDSMNLALQLRSSLEKGTVMHYLHQLEHKSTASSP